MIDIHEAAQGRWRGILATFGLTQREMSGKHGPCPICADGTDRFRFDDKDGRGSWICSHCGAGSGVDMVMKLKGVDFKGALDLIRPLIGAHQPEPVKPGLSVEAQRRFRRELWAASQPVQRGDPVDLYLRSRGVDQPSYPAQMRFCRSARYSEGVYFPAMVCAMQDTEGNGVSLHRTFLKGSEKAPVDSPRMLMPGTIPPGSAVRLGDPGESLGIAEGIETALAAADRFELPVWAAISASLLAEWMPPEGVSEVAIFGDNDASFHGQSAAYALARRLKRLKISVSVHIPPKEGQDWADFAVEREKGN